MLQTRNSGAGGGPREARSQKAIRNGEWGCRRGNRWLKRTEKEYMGGNILQMRYGRAGGGPRETRSQRVR